MNDSLDGKRIKELEDRLEIVEKALVGLSYIAVFEPFIGSEKQIEASARISKLTEEITRRSSDEDSTPSDT
jgi:hypothetical protein